MILFRERDTGLWLNPDTNLFDSTDPIDTEPFVDHKNPNISRLVKAIEPFRKGPHGSIARIVVDDFTQDNINASIEKSELEYFRFHNPHLQHQWDKSYLKSLEWAVKYYNSTILTRFILSESMIEYWTILVFREVHVP